MKEGFAALREMIHRTLRVIFENNGGVLIAGPIFRRAIERATDKLNTSH
jgi:hypothetical protein